MISFIFLQEFTNDYENFVQRISDLDRRLATIICQGFEDCSGMESVFKVAPSLFFVCFIVCFCKAYDI